MKTVISYIILIAALLPCKINLAQGADLPEIKNIFQDVEKILSEERSGIWGKNLYGALMLVDPSTRTFYANEQDLSKSFTEKEGIYTGKLDARFNIANTAMKIKGKDWTMVILPLPEDNDSKRALIIHELFHNFQNKMGLKYQGMLPEHLEKRQARVLMRLEWNALLAALSDTLSDMKHHIESALLFRGMRRILFTGSAEKENSFELMEGMAEYTGLALGIKDKAAQRAYMKGRIKMLSENLKPMVRSFAYISGPLYGLLMDHSGKKWQDEILRDMTDPGVLISSCFHLENLTPAVSLVEKRKNEYDGEEIERSEREREEKNNRIAAEYKKKFVDDAVLLLPFADAGYQFNPMEVLSLDGIGTIYPNIRVVSKWGILTASKGAALLPGNWLAVSPPLKTGDGKISGDGWELELSNDWQIVSKGSSFTVEEKTPRKAP